MFVAVNLTRVEPAPVWTPRDYDNVVCYYYSTPYKHRAPEGHDGHVLKFCSRLIAVAVHPSKRGRDFCRQGIDAQQLRARLSTRMLGAKVAAKLSVAKKLQPTAFPLEEPNV